MKDNFNSHSGDTNKIVAAARIENSQGYECKISGGVGIQTLS